MDYSIRDSGIDMIGEIPWGTHIAQLFESKEDYLKIMVPYIQSGLIKNELCIWIYGEQSNEKEITEILNCNFGDIEYYLERGQLRLIKNTEWYLEDETFSDTRVNDQWNKLVAEALDSGYDGLRAVADGSWLNKSYWKIISEYEQKVHSIISESPFIAACLYDATKLGPFEIADIIKNHSYIITKNEDKYELLRNKELLIKDRQLQKSNKRYKELIQLLPDAVFIHDEKRIFYCNEAAERIAGMSDNHRILGISIVDFIPSEMQDDFRNYIKESFKDDVERNYMESKFVCFTGEIKDVEIITTKYNSKRHPALLSVVRDVTPFRRIKELESYDKIKTEFFANISHEFKTPLSVMLSAIQLMNSNYRKIGVCEKERKYMKSIQQNCYRLLRLVNNLIDITKIDSNYFELNLQNYNIIKLVENITMSVTEYAQQKGLTIDFSKNINERIIACDPDQIERIILNLISNAIKFTPRGGKISVIANDCYDNIQIKVRDTGVGIPYDMQRTIFERFQRDSSFKRRCEGSGIGLSIVQALVEKHGGTVTVQSEVGKGSEFTVNLPCKVLPEEENTLVCRMDMDNNYYVEKIKIEFSDIYR